MSDLNVSPHVSVEPASGPPDGGAPPDAGSFASEAAAPERGPSPFDGLAAKLREKRAQLHKDFIVPRWRDAVGLDVYVRYSPLSPSYRLRTVERFQASKAPEWEILADAQMLVHCCVGIYAIDPAKPEERFALSSASPDGEWPTFTSGELATTIGAPATVGDGGGAIGTCRKLYWTDGDLSAASAQLFEWSTQLSEEAEDFPRP